MQRPTVVRTTLPSNFFGLGLDLHNSGFLRLRCSFDGLPRFIGERHGRGFFVGDDLRAIGEADENARVRGDLAEIVSQHALRAGC